VTHDQTIDPNLERLFALTMNATTVEIPSSHVVMLLHPFEVAAVIRKAAAVLGRAALKGITNETHAGCDL
jgi:hypothetical protein